LKHLKLCRPVAALIKLSHRSRLKHKLVFRDGSGYICILSGIADRDELPTLSRNAAILRSLTELYLDDQSLSSPQSFDNPFRSLPILEKHSPPAPKGKIAAVLHLYYTELWPEFAAFLNQILCPFDLWITHCSLDGTVRAQILQSFPQTQIVQVENRGRDIWPFISLLNQNAFAKYEYICKIHSKKSAHKPGEKESLLGSRWRRRALYDLLAAGRAEHVIDMFERDATLGIVGPRTLRMPHSRYNNEKAWGTDRNRQLAMQLAHRMGIQMGEKDLDFFAGSMFWVRRRALEPIQLLNLRRDDFPDECGQLDSELQHALERLFSVSASLAGFNVSGITPLEFPNNGHKWPMPEN